jgi:hypothetical protein
LLPWLRGRKLFRRRRTLDPGPSVSLHKRTGVFSLEHYLTSRTLLRAGHVARIPNSRSPKRLMLSWVLEPRIAGGQEMT